METTLDLESINLGCHQDSRIECNPLISPHEKNSAPIQSLQSLHRSLSVQVGVCETLVEPKTSRRVI